MKLKSLEITGFKSFGKKVFLSFDSPITAIVGPNGSGKSNVAEAFRWVLGEQSLKSLRGKKGEDLIFNGSSTLGRLNHANVEVIFDNSDRRFNLDYDEVIISREVFRDGTNEYKINGSQVRLKDILELLSSVSLGSSGHHIISQGEADRILNTSITERRTIIEEALGLRLYQWKLSESEKKLAKTEENKRQVESLRREIAPHLKFLKKQVEKIERANELRLELKGLYFDYLKREDIYLSYAKNKVAEEIKKPREELSRLGERLEEANSHLNQKEGDPREAKLRGLDSEIRLVRGRREDAGRKLGRLEGMMEALKVVRPKVERSSAQVPLEKLESFTSSLEELVNEAQASNDLGFVRSLLVRAKSLFSDLVNIYRQREPEPEVSDNAERLGELNREKGELENQISAFEEEERRKAEEYQSLRTEIEKSASRSQEAQRLVYELRAKKSELSAELEMALSREENLKAEEENFKRELTEAGVLVGREILNYDSQEVNVSEVISESRSAQEERRRRIEKIKIRLEDMGGESTDVLKEYEETNKRDEYLGKELEDLEASAKSLEEVMVELRAKIDSEFKEGIKKINREFQKFFEILFGGGTASLEVIVPAKKKEKLTEGLEEIEEVPEMEEEGGKEGIEITVSLPRKKIKGLAMLSGGERALTSIALLFAMSQVNPPPFLILDETDAALDEANSRKYGDMIENLGQYSQLILITHNRETMSRAGVLYGVTMGSDSVSRLLSIKFDEATAYAK